MNDENTLEVYRLIIGPDEIEYEAENTVKEYLAARAASYGNKLGLQRKRVQDFDIAEDPLSGGYVLVFMCERYF